MACFHQPGAIPWLNAFGVVDHAAIDAILDQLAHLKRVEGTSSTMHASGQIIGPHVTGKSTLLKHAASCARARGWCVVEVRPPRRIHWRQFKPLKQIDAPRAQVRLLCIDSAELISRLGWRFIRAYSAIQSVRILATTHRDLGLECVAQHELTPTLACTIVARLLACESLAAPSEPGMAQLLARYQGSLRHVFFELYERYEQGW